jgi:tetratricopeptide (TPR) repeat protein
VQVIVREGSGPVKAKGEDRSVPAALGFAAAGVVDLAGESGHTRRIAFAQGTIMKKSQGMLFKIILFLVVLFVLATIQPVLFVVLILGGLIYLAYRYYPDICEVIGRLAYGRTGNLDAGIRWLERAEKTDRAKPKTTNAYAFLILKSGDMERAEAIVDDLLNRNLPDGDRHRAETTYALILWKRGQLEEAIELLETALSENFRTSNLYASLGYMLLEKGDLQRAMEVNVEAYDYDDDNTVILDNFATTYLRHGEVEKAERIYAQLMQKNPHFPEAYYGYAQLLLAQDRERDALHAMDQALAKDFSFLSTVTREQVEQARQKLASHLGDNE